jgi:hypothetical protein
MPCSVINVKGKIYIYLTLTKRKLKQWWSTIPPISTKRTSISHLNWFSTKKRAYDLGNLGPGLVKAPKMWQGWTG